MKWTWKDTCVIGIIVLAVAVFFFRLFWPTPQLIVTPDFSRSDSFDFSISTKFLLSQSLRSGNIPLWTPLIGDGFPIFAEGQIGTFFLPNLILFRFFPFVMAYNTAIVLSVLIGGIGTFLWLRVMKITRPIALFAGISIALSGPVLTQLTHIALLQSFTLLPLIMAITYMNAVKPSIKTSLLLGFFVAEQILAGSPQGVFITQLFSIPYLLFLTWQQPQRMRSFINYVTGIGIALLLGAVQLLPSYEFSRFLASDTNQSLFPGADYSFPLIHLLTFINPFALGNPQNGTYTAFATYTGSIFWENSGYIGIIPLLGAVAAFVRPKRQTRRTILFFAGAALIGLLLMTGRFGPVYILYALWPFSLFHVPSRFIWVFVLSLVMLGSLGIEHALKNLRHAGARISVFLILIAGQCLMLSLPWYHYHAMTSSADATTPPDIISGISKTQRTYTIGASQTYNTVFNDTGWKSFTPYTFLKNALIPNSNLYWNIPTHGVTTGRTLRRSALMDTLLLGEIQTSEKGATVSANGQKLLDLLHIGQIVSTVPVFDPSLTAAGTLRDHTLAVYTYKNVTALPRVYLARPSETADTLDKAKSVLFSNSFSIGHSVLLEQSIDGAFAADSGSTTITQEKDARLTISVTDHPHASFLVLTDTYYPGWQATIDGQQASIYPANISQRAVLVPKGDHTVTFSYMPRSFIIGAWVSGISWLLLICSTGFAAVFAAVRTDPRMFGRVKDHQRNRDMSRLHKT